MHCIATANWNTALKLFLDVTCLTKRVSKETERKSAVKLHVCCIQLSQPIYHEPTSFLISSVPLSIFDVLFLTSACAVSILEYQLQLNRVDGLLIGSCFNAERRRSMTIFSSFWSNLTDFSFWYRVSSLSRARRSSGVAGFIDMSLKLHATQVKRL